MGTTETPHRPAPRYNLSAEELAAEQDRLLSDIQEICPKPGVYCVWIGHDSPYADIVRTHESGYWESIADIMTDKEEASEFLLVVDTRDPQTEGVKRVSRITFPTDCALEHGRTGMAIVDDIINSEQGLDLDEFVEYYTDRSVDLARCFSVETNIRVEGAERYNGLPLAEIGYLAMFERIDKLRHGGLSYIFAAINEDSVNSFKLIDLQAEPLAGRSELKTPGEEDHFLEGFITVALPTTKHNLAIFQKIDSLSAPIVTLS